MNPWFEKKIAVNDSILFAWSLPWNSSRISKYQCSYCFSYAPNVLHGNWKWWCPTEVSNFLWQLVYAASSPLTFRVASILPWILSNDDVLGKRQPAPPISMVFLQDIHSLVPFHGIGTVCVIPFSSQFPQSHPLCQLWNTILTFGKAGTLGAICRLKPGNLRRLEA